MNYANGCTFSGIFRHDKRMSGTFKDPNSKRVYVGEYKHDLPHGQGKYFEDENLVFEGKFKHGHCYDPQASAPQDRPDGIEK